MRLELGHGPVFARQGMMKALGAILEGVELGQVDIRLPFRADLTQQHGFRHAGAMTNAVDSAPGYSALALSRRGGSAHGEVQVNLIGPGKGDTISVRGRVLKAGRTLLTGAGDVFAIGGAEEKPFLTMLNGSARFPIT